MESFITILEKILTYVVQFSVTVLEFFGVFILVYTAVRCFISWTRKDHFVPGETILSGSIWHRESPWHLNSSWAERSFGPSLPVTGTNFLYWERSSCSAVF